MKPPSILEDVRDIHGGFTAIVPTRGLGGRMDGPTNTLWRTGAVLSGYWRGTLDNYDEGSFYQTNNDVTLAIYRVPRYRYRVAVWYDNVTGQRIA